MNASKMMIAETKRTAHIMGLLAIDSHMSADSASYVVNELRYAGIHVDVADILNALRSSGAYFHHITNECAVPGHVKADWTFDLLQDDLQDASGLKGPALYCAWAKVKARLRIRWAAGNYNRPTAAMMLRWIA